MFKVVRNKNRNFFLIVFGRVLWDRSNDPCPAFVRYRYRIEISPQIFYFSRDTAVQESLMVPFVLAKNAQTTLCLKGCNICLQEDKRVKVGSMSPWNIGNCPRQLKMIQLPTVFMLLQFESKNDVFSEKLQKLGTKLELVTCLWLSYWNFSVKLSGSTWIPPKKSARFARIFWEILHFEVWEGKKLEKLDSFPYRGMTTLPIYSWYSLANFKFDQKDFICIPSSNFTKMRL